MSIAIEEVQVYIRRSDNEGWNEGWIQGRDHHKAAFDIFLKDETKSRVQTRMCIGRDFIADFSKVGEEVYKYSDEYGRIVQISYMTPGKASFINNGIIYEM
jgi:hypothetical protein